MADHRRAAAALRFPRAAASGDRDRRNGAATGRHLPGRAHDREQRLEQPLDVDTGTTLVLDFDVGRSFGYNVDPLFDFVFTPVLRAVRADRTGGLIGTVRGDPDGTGAPQPIADAIVTVYRGSALAAASSWWVAATGRTDADGDYRVGFLLPGAYIVRLESPWSTRFGALTTPDVPVRVGEESRLDVTLPAVPGATQR
jgi:hypothetical protein